MSKRDKLFVANRGEIAVRIIRAARELGIACVVPYSDVDCGSLTVRLADECISLGGSSARDTYLNQEKLINAARQSGATLVHPGYGFFAENADFAQAVIDNGMTFVGPSPEVISLMADKDQARKRMQKAKVPVVPGTEAGIASEEFAKFSKKAGYPVMVKAVAGGSGRGMRIVRSEAELEQRVSEAQREAAAAFGNDLVFVEKYIERPRHIEVQVFGAGDGRVLHFGERECSLQRRHQKVVEEAPAATLHPKLRERILAAAVSAASEVHYLGAGTVEFLVEGEAGEKSKFYFLEMNTRIQVEHPVTEAISGVDLVKLQISTALGKPLELEQSEIAFSGHAFEFRVYAEDPSRDFAPTSGQIKYISRPGGPGVREDSWVEVGSKISSYYDSLLSKLVVWGSSRSEAIERSRSALRDFIVDGPCTTLGFHRWLVEEEDFASAQFDVAWIERKYQGEMLPAGSVGPLEVPLPNEKTLER